MAQHVDVTGLAQAIAKMHHLAAQGHDLTDFLAAIANSEHTRVMDRFDLSVDPLGRPWKRLKYRHGQPLVDTGDLRKSIKYVVRRNYCAIGTNISYAPYHQFGTARIPKRPFLGVSQELKDEINDFLRIHFNI